MRIGVATDHGGFGLKQELVVQLHAVGHEVIDFGARIGSALTTTIRTLSLLSATL
jgi:ribose 5-phosphate isomerase RpiB